MMKFLLRRKRSVSLFFVCVMVLQITAPGVSFALTAGPTQPEVQSFKQAGTTEMVDLFSGDFSYNIPLFELPGPNGGYPFNLSYQSGIGMDQEASWVGLGWSLNAGAITRQMRGLPDEFKGDEVVTKMTVKPSVTIGVGSGAEIELFGKSLSLGMGFSISQNNYKGLGYSIDSSIGFGKAVGSGMKAGVGVSVSLNSQEGVNVNPSLGLGGRTGSLGVGANYNSKEGLSSVTLDMSVEKVGDVQLARTASASVRLYAAHPTYTPQISMPSKNINLAFTAKVGAGWWGVSGLLYARGFYNEQWLKDDKKNVKAKAYGYLNYQHAAGDARALLDFNREKDGMVMRENPNLAMPSLTYDFYAVSGQGISAMYRPMRNDIGIIHDQQTVSGSVGVATGGDVGIAAHYGASLTLNHAKSVSGPWKSSDNPMAGITGFRETSHNELFEPVYFKVHGEPGAESGALTYLMQGDTAVRVALDGRSNVTTTTNLAYGDDIEVPAPGNADIRKERKTRNQLIQPITREQLRNDNSNAFSYMNIQYIDNRSNAEQQFDRSSGKDHHIAAFTALTPEGLRYNYGLPAYNHVHEQGTFAASKESDQVTRVSVGNTGGEDPEYHAPGSDEFMKRVMLPPYVHAHLLTSILGPDYVDVDNNGVSENDLGYWVKFTYRKTTDEEDRYQWRDPFYQAHLQEGWHTDPADDKGTYTYGQKDMWYLARAETKSHVAIFEIALREDGKGAKYKLQDSPEKGDTPGNASYRLKQIRLFTQHAYKQEGAGIPPIKVVNFHYDYSLCKGIDNNSTAGGGKLTLTSLDFAYGGSQRGTLNPYYFTYNASYKNKDFGYDMLAYDRWGNYKPYPENKYDHNRDFPYVEQDTSKRDDVNAYAAAWSLSEIQLPSGGKVQVDYEADDYAYVQHLPAMQMTEILRPEGQENYKLSEGDLKVRFKLEIPVDGTITDPARLKEEVLKYIDEKRQLYFKIKINLRQPGSNFYEYVCGYADINMDAEMGLVGGNDLNGDGVADYESGYFYLHKEQGYHPFSLRAWQHLRTNQPMLTNTGRNVALAGSTKDRVNQINKLKTGNVVSQVRQMFRGFYEYCSSSHRQWGRELDAAHSWIRLKSPDKIKCGGGLRVRQITLQDQWAGDKEGVYGQVYDYTINEEGKTISSGVAAYEPFIGGDENAVRYAKKYVQSISMRSDNNLFFEYPINESYYPGPGVGYRKVTVMSLAAASLAGVQVKQPDGSKLFPSGGNGYGTTGKTVHEFYTAREFPVFTDETDKRNIPYNLQIPVPLLGSISVSKLAASQGYSIVTNDMHGRQKKASNFRQDNTGAFEADPISWVAYQYRTKPRVYGEQQVLSLVNNMRDNGDGTLSTLTGGESVEQVYALGQETEFFHDMRQFEDNTWTGGGQANVDVLYFFIGAVPMPTMWPSVSKSTTQLRTTVTNKIIFRAGILETVEAYDGGSLVKTKNLKWDKLTGVPVLTVVNNNFDAPVYKYNIAAHTQYQGMGAAYQNIGFAFDLDNVTQDAYRDTQYTFTFAAGADAFFPGDEILLYPPDKTVITPITRVVCTGKDEGVMTIYSPVTLNKRDYRGVIIRSGYRNQLSVSAGTITALKDPTLDQGTATYTHTMKIPK